MQQLTIEHKNLKKDRREGKGRVLAISRMVYRLQNTDTSFYCVESETRDDQYYLCKFKPDVLEDSWYCSCKDNSIRGLKCKHLSTIEFAIKWGTIKDIEELPIGARQQQYPPQQTSVVATAVVQSSKSYLDDEYDF